MKQIVTRFGIGLSTLSFITLMIFIVLPAIVPLPKLPLIQNIIQAVFCKSGETLNPTYSTFETPGTTVESTTLDCVNREGQKRDVGDAFLQSAFVGYLVTFLGGIVIVGVAQYWPTQQATPAPSTTQAFHENSTPKEESHPHHEKHPSGGTPSQSTLKARLTELKSALDAGVITEAEYFVKLDQIMKES